MAKKGDKAKKGGSLKRYLLIGGAIVAFIVTCIIVAVSLTGEDGGGGGDAAGGGGTADPRCTMKFISDTGVLFSNQVMKPASVVPINGSDNNLLPYRNTTPMCDAPGGISDPDLGHCYYTNITFRDQGLTELTPEQREQYAIQVCSDWCKNSRSVMEGDVVVSEECDFGSIYRTDPDRTGFTCNFFNLQYGSTLEETRRPVANDTYFYRECS